MQKVALEALGKLRAIGALAELIERLGHSNSDLRKAAALALGELRAPRAVPALNGLAHDPDVEVRKAAARALEAIGRSPDLSHEEN